MRLELKHIAPYLPYGLKIFTLDDDFKPVIQEIRSLFVRHNEIESSELWQLAFHEFKPILRPLTDIANEIEHNGERLTLLKKLWSDYDLRIDRDNYLYFDYYEIGSSDSPFTGYNCIQALIEYHFDVFGLIKEGLAIDINTIKNV